jgi:hypothetical protein
LSVEYGIITSVVMPGGWHYAQKISTGQTVEITAFSFEELLSNMLDFRLRHLELCGAPSANIEAVRKDLKDYLCANYRQNCADSPNIGSLPAASGPGIGNRADYDRPLDRAGQWIAELGNTRPERVDYALAGSRAQTCAQCPQNIRWKSPCQPCNDNILVRIQQAKGSLYTPLDSRLFMCRIFGHINEVAIWLPDTHSSSENPPPSNCWKITST